MAAREKVDRGWIFRLGKKARGRLRGVFARQSLVGDPVVFENGTFPWTRMLEDAAPEIRKELDRLLEYRRLLPPFHEISKYNDGIATDGRWKVFMLYAFGAKAKRSCGLCPTTSRILEAIPGLKTAWFSILEPRYHVPRHKGVTKGLIRCHLGLKVPADREGCRIQIGGTVATWEEGRCLVFDDTRRHEVWNETDEERVVLLIDVDRPMRFLGRLLSRTFNTLVRFTPYYRDARRSHRAWEEAFHRELGKAGVTAGASG